MRGDNAREAAERFVAEDREVPGRLLIGGVPVTAGPGWGGPEAAALIRPLRRVVEELIRERDKEVAESAGLVLRDRRGRADG